MIVLKEYQQKAISKLKMDITEHLEQRNENSIIVFQAPTGSGKTITCAELLKTLVLENHSKRPLSFIWISTNKLHEQSKDKLTAIYEDTKILQCSDFDDLENNMIGENEIWFVNWEKINQQKKNVIIRENETEKYLTKIIENTKEGGHDIMLIIDESHNTAQSDRAQEIISMIGPQITLEVSATPILKNQDFFHKIRLEDVKQEEMIKNEVLINPKIDQEVVDEKSATELVINQSIKKQQELKKMYADEGTDINPLILVQLPTTQRGITDKKEEILEEYKKHGKTIEAGNLAIWLSEDHSPTLSNIEKPTSEVDVLLFKQAIALGWDCPRAAILVIFRETKSLEFTIQVIGRIMRMPEHKHYTKNPELNNGYILTNLEEITLSRDYVENYAKQYYAERNDKLYTPLKLQSVYFKPHRERTRLAGEFRKMFDQAAKETSLREKIDVSVSTTTLDSKIIADAKITDIDNVEIVSTSTSPATTAGGAQGHTFSFDISEVEIQRRFDVFVNDVITPFASYDSSTTLNTTLYNWLYKNFEIEKYSSDAQIIILHKANQNYFQNTIHIAKEKYQKKFVDDADALRESTTNSDWEVPKVQATNHAEHKSHYQKCIITPAHVKFASTIERQFVEKLETDEFSNKIDWWYKNGEKEIKYFAVSYKDKYGVQRPFYVDFIIRFSNGKIGLFDTKDGRTAEDAKEKAEGLAQYIKTHSTDDKPLVGGIVIFQNNMWLYNDNITYKYDPNNLSDWKLFSGIING